MVRTSYRGLALTDMVALEPTETDHARTELGAV